MTEPPTTPEPSPSRPRRDGLVWSKVAAELGREPYAPPARIRPPGGWPKTGDVGATAQLQADEEPVTVPARPYGEPRFAAGGVVFPQTDGDVIPFVPTGCLHRHGPPPASELRAIAADLNAHGGLDETFVAELLRQAADPYADAKRGLGIVDPPPPVTTTKPITYEEIVAALEKIAPLGPQRLDVVKLTQEQIDAVTASQPHVAPSAEPWHYFGTPVEIVETVEESTPYELANAQPGGIVEFRGNLTEAEFETLRADWLRAIDAKPWLPRWIVEADREFVAHVNDGVDRAAVLDVVCAAAGVVGPPVPAELRPRSWWRRALDRVRRWGR